MNLLDFALLTVGTLAGWYVTGAALRWRRLRRDRGRALR
ncbi:MAG: hypothetical protein JWM10_3722 [Myxococcaceae bacterium]|nr:hypothetical protein [Myxococcaceae bacterium]